jgi:hypothetical protein
LSPRRLDPVWVALAASGVGGFAVGAFGYATWQVAVESAQVLAGLVSYPRDNPFYMYHTKIWTIVHQIAALLLWAGLSEKTVSILVSGVLGAVSFQALALSSLALSRDVWLAVGTPFFIEYTRATAFWISYPVWLLGASHTYGILGLSAALLTVALFASGAHRTGAAALGLMPAVHPSIGAWLWLLIILVVATDFRRLQEPLRRAMPAFVSGAAVSAASLAFHLLCTVDVPRADPAFATRTLMAFVRVWDGHRQPITFDLPGVRLAFGTTLLSGLALWLRPGLRRLGPSFLLRFLIAAGVLGAVLILASWAPPERLPETLLVLMPNRLLNLNVLAGVTALVGLLAASPDWRFRATLASLLVLGAVVPQVVGVTRAGPNGSTHAAYHFVQWPEGWPFPALAATSFAFVLAALLPGSRGLPAAEATPVKPPAPRRRRRARAPSRAGAAAVVAATLYAIALAALGFTTLATLARTVENVSSRAAEFRDWRDDPLLARVHREPGLLATASDLHLVQLRTRRPVVIDGGGLDFVTYTLEAAPALDHILRHLYGVDLFAPPPGAAPTGSLPLDYNRAVWESRSADEWRAIGSELGVTGVLVYPDWTIHLRLVDKNDEFAYYSLAP